MAGTGGNAPRIQVFRPTMEEFKNFSKYIEYMESQGAHKAGLAKIIPPEGWIPRKSGYDEIDLVIPSPITQYVSGRQGLYQQLNISHKGLTVQEFRKMAESDKYKTPAHFDYEDLERKYWKNITYGSPIYGADVSGSLYDDGVEEFNIQHLNTILDLVKQDYAIQIEGVNTAYLYFGMWKTTFAWHTEDMDLYSINYVHYGAPKSWYVIPPEHGKRLERLASGFFHHSNAECSAFLRHKMTIISPHILKKFSIPYSKITQEPGEFMITFPYAYHSGFNHGFNIAESTNFALPRWIEYGKRSTPCVCRNDCVKICMEIFVKKFQPDRYQLWLEGKDIGYHPENPARMYAAPAPKKMELAVSAQRLEYKKLKEMQKIKRHPVSKFKAESKSNKDSTEDSDEETKLYDVNELSEAKKAKKKARKIRREYYEKKPKKKLKTTPHIKKEIFEGNEIVKNEKTDNHTMELLQASMDTSTEEESIDNSFTQTITDVSMEVAEEKKVDTNPPKVEINENEKNTVLDIPPRLMPFWDPNEKLKNVTTKEVCVENEIDSSKEKLLEYYPNLQKAVNAGSFSVVPLKTSPRESDFIEKVKTKSEFEEVEKTRPLLLPVEPKASEFSVWRCETNGLKIKFVQPKKQITDASLSTSPSESFSSDQFSQISPSYSPATSSDTSIQSEISSSHHEDQNSSNEISPSEPLVQPGPSKTKVKVTDTCDLSWANPLANIWQHQPRNFEKEIAYNEKLASIPPHCSVCVIFTPMYNVNSFPSKPTHVPSYSPVKMPAFCYGNTLNSECMLDTNSLLRMDGTAPLLTCSSCKVCVHATCYGVSMLPSTSWLCSRCSTQSNEAECCLCVHRGGALKPTTDGRWAHINCAILISETYFENTTQKEPVNVSKITAVRQRLRCKYCFKTLITKEHKGACVQCRSGKCYLPFHVTCGYMAGVIFETCDWPEPIHMICTKHVAARRRPPKRELTSVSVGERVIAKHRNKRYYWANVTSKCIQEYYSILFDDNSHSTNTLPEDIVSRSITTQGTPQMNEKVLVKWPDGEFYNGIFKGSQTCELFVIEFDDGSIMRLERKEIYAADEELPKHVKARVSHATESSKIDYGSETDGKRIRMINHKYS